MEPLIRSFFTFYYTKHFQALHIFPSILASDAVRGRRIGSCTRLDQLPNVQCQGLPHPHLQCPHDGSMVDRPPRGGLAPV
jgi:hypothetical protein